MNHVLVEVGRNIKIVVVGILKKSIIENPDYIVEDNRHEDTMIYLKEIDDSCIIKVQYK